ncbi:GTP-binding protein LepA [Aquipuribacter hungaricus]|uniref:GTP-binding protein LepA n=1 Tax=Aquipuribacter hungaricus TaxID=545624 RepID=A0ABV7WJI1_9MICO
MGTATDIDAQIDRIEADGAISLDSVDFTVPDPRRVRKELGPALDYFARIEREVERNVLELQVVLPQADERTVRFVKVWEEQELPHGWIFDRMQQEVGLPPSQPELDQIGRTLRLAGVLSHVPGVHDALMFLYLSIGAMHERLTAVGYDRLRERVLELGMPGFAQTAVRPIRAQESMHYAYYRNAAVEQRDRLAGWQLHLARVVRRHTYVPVGATTAARRADFGGAAVALVGGRDVGALSEPVQRVAQELLTHASDGLRLPPFVAAALRDCVDAHVARQAVATT